MSASKCLINGEVCYLIPAKVVFGPSPVQMSAGQGNLGHTQKGQSNNSQSRGGKGRKSAHSALSSSLCELQSYPHEVSSRRLIIPRFELGKETQSIQVDEADILKESCKIPEPVKTRFIYRLSNISSDKVGLLCEVHPSKYDFNLGSESAPGGSAVKYTKSSGFEYRRFPVWSADTQGIRNFSVYPSITKAYSNSVEGLKLRISRLKTPFQVPNTGIALSRKINDFSTSLKRQTISSDTVQESQYKDQSSSQRSQSQESNDTDSLVPSSPSGSQDSLLEMTPSSHFQTQTEVCFKMPSVSQEITIPDYTSRVKRFLIHSPR